MDRFKASLEDLIAQQASFEAEQSVIGAVLIDNLAFRKVSMVQPNHFYHRHHQIIWEEVRRMSNARLPVDLVTLNEAIDGIGQIENVGGFAYLADLAKNTPSSANVKAYADIVLDRSYRRALIRSCRETITATSDFGKSSETIASSAIDVMSMIRAGGGFRNIDRHVKDVAEDWAKEFESRMTPDGNRGLTTGFTDLDKLLYPKNVVDGALFVVGARPKMGKTAFSLKTVDHITGLGHSGLVFSMEMSDTQLVERSLVQMGNVKTTAMYPSSDGTLSADDGELSLVMATLGRFIERDLYIATKPAVGIGEMERTIRNRHSMTNGRLKAVWVDYLTLMDIDENSARHDLGYAAITKRLKVLAKELNLVIFLLIQLNRGLENRTDKRPMPSDGRETGQIEQDCDYWLGIYRDHVYNESSDPSHCELLLRLNRHGSTGKVHAKFAGGRFDDWSGSTPITFSGKGKPIDI